MKRYTIEINKNNNTFDFRNRSNNPSKKLDDIILSNLIKMNPFLIGKKKSDSALLDAMFDDAGLEPNDRITIYNNNNGYLLKGNFDSDFAMAADFLSSYTPKKKTYFFKNTPIEFFEDEIQIGNILIPLYKLSSPKYYNTFTPETKNLIIDIFISINR